MRTKNYKIIGIKRRRGCHLHWR